MKKITSIIALMFAAISAHAQTVINLTDYRCAANWCQSVPNDAGDTVLIYWSPQYGTFGVYLNGDSYFVRRAPFTVPFYKVPTEVDFPGIVLTDPNGKQLVLDMKTYEWWVLGGSGRGQSWHPQTELLSGTLTVYP